MSEVGLSEAARGRCTPAEGSTSASRRRAPGYPGRSSSGATARPGRRRCGSDLVRVHRNVSADGTVAMTESDAAPLLSAGRVRA